MTTNQSKHKRIEVKINICNNCLIKDGQVYELSIDKLAILQEMLEHLQKTDVEFFISGDLWK